MADRQIANEIICVTFDGEDLGDLFGQIATYLRLREEAIEARPIGTPEPLFTLLAVTVDHAEFSANVFLEEYIG